ncbi:MAG: class I SAM-dependent methyltransferase [Mycobacterium sp.]|nr:class I SAM-dependent methyltransferase [Mycobacterium sp.]
MSKVAFVRRLLSEYHYSPAVLPVLWNRIRTGTLPNTRQANRALWGSYNWSAEGEEWSNKEIPGWKESIVEKLLLPFIAEGLVVLEIGPGAGRWTEHIVEHAAKLTLVDVTPECIAMCRQRFADKKNIEFHVNEGNDLSFVESSTIDRVWSFDVFVHILAVDVEPYVSEISRVLVPGGQALIHHSKNGASSGPWRSDMTDGLMREFAQRNGLEVVDQFESWGDGIQRLWPELPPEQNHDVITLLRKPSE